jgi:hypothetical protein
MPEVEGEEAGGDVSSFYSSVDIIYSYSSTASLVSSVGSCVASVVSSFCSSERAAIFSVSSSTFTSVYSAVVCSSSAWSDISIFYLSLRIGRNTHPFFNFNIVL